MKWNIPNQLTVSRIFLAAIFFVLLGMYGPNSPMRSMLMGTGFVIYVLAGITDVLDGYLARRLDQVSAFGRIVDPIVDKVLVAGAFVMFAGPDFAMHLPGEAGLAGQVASFEASLPRWLTGEMTSTVQPWMAVVILGREFVISGLRGYSESLGNQFPAIKIGKLKMLLQCFAIGAILFYLAWAPQTTWVIITKIGLVWLSVIITVVSGFVYIYKAGGLLRDK